MTISDSTPAETPHEARRRRRLAGLCLATALFAWLLGSASNNVQGAAQDARNYLPILFFGIAMLLGSAGMLVASALQGERWMRLASALFAVVVVRELLAVGTRISEILNGP